MGSFNVSCAVSKCSINPGDRVKLIPIVSNDSLHPEYKNTMHLGFGCYTWDYFQFIGYAMNATYEDYGNFEVSENFASLYNLSIIKENYTQTPLPPDKEISKYVDRDGYYTTASDLNWEIISNMIHCGTLFLDSNPDYSRRNFLGYFPIHESIYNLLLNRNPDMYFEESYEEVPFAKYLQKQMKKFDSDVSDEFEEYLTKYMDLYSDSIGEIHENGTLITADNVYKRAYSMAEFKTEVKESGKEFSYKNTASIKQITNFCKENLDIEFNDALLRDIITTDAELTYLVNGLSTFNIPMLPPMTAGQEYDKTEHATFLIRMGQEMIKIQTAHDEDDDEESNAITPVLNNFFNVSLNKLKKATAKDWKSERGLRVAGLIDKFITEYPDSVKLSKSELELAGYGEMVGTFSSTLLDFVFINDIEID